MFKRTTVLGFVFVAIFAIALFAKEVVATKAIKKTAYSSLDEALKQGKPVVCLFYTAKACPCTNKKCSDTRTELSTWMGKFDSSLVYYELEVADHNALVQKYKIMTPPAMLIFDKNGEQKFRLESWQITGSEIDKKLSELKAPPKRKTNVKQSNK
jgi:hypothetical protein